MNLARTIALLRLWANSTSYEDACWLMKELREVVDADTPHPDDEKLLEEIRGKNRKPGP